MIHEKKLKYVKVNVERLEECCNSYKYTSHNIPINCFYNCYITFEKIKCEVSIALSFLFVIILMFQQLLTLYKCIEILIFYSAVQKAQNNYIAPCA